LVADKLEILPNSCFFSDNAQILITHNSRWWNVKAISRHLSFEKWQENNTFDLLTLTIKLELESVSIESFFQVKKWKRGLVSTIVVLPQ